MPASLASITLAIRSGPHVGESFTFDGYNTVVVGRGEDASWKLTRDPYFSRYHFRVECNPPACKLVDLESRNGTLVNGQRVAEADLKHGDRIECGETVFEVVVVLPPPPTAAETLDLPPHLGEVQPTVNLSSSPGPERIADFDIKRELGRGSMGVVYLAVHRTTRQYVAVKLIEPQVAAKPAAVQLFLREAHILSQLHHPRIVEYVSLGLHDGRMFVAMEYVPTLDVRLLLRSQSRPRQIRLACGLACYMLEGLQHAHEHDIVHRDVKPSNVLVFKHQGKVNLKLADFGLAKNYLNAGFSSVSCENQVRGTLAYMAPEQLLNCRFAKPACDIYGAGACLYELLCGKLPIEIEEGSNFLARLLNSSPTALPERSPDVPQELADLVHRALAREPGDRFSSAEHMRKSLLKFVQ